MVGQVHTTAQAPALSQRIHGRPHRSAEVVANSRCRTRGGSRPPDSRSSTRLRFMAGSRELNITRICFRKPADGTTASQLMTDRLLAVVLDCMNEMHRTLEVTR